MKSLLPLAFASLLPLGCGGAATGADAPAGGAPPPETTDPAAADAAPGAEAPASPETAPGAEAAPAKPAKPETKKQRRQRLKQARLAQCKPIGEAMQKALDFVTITSATDQAELKRVSGELNSVAADLDKSKVEPELTALQQLRDDYARNTREMAKELTTAGKTNEIEKQRAALARFRKLEPKMREFITKLNEVCNAPIE